MVVGGTVVVGASVEVDCAVEGTACSRPVLPSVDVQAATPMAKATVREGRRAMAAMVLSLTFQRGFEDDNKTLRSCCTLINDHHQWSMRTNRENV